MIIAKINGGLGNQIFQYVIARHLSLKNKDELGLDISVFKDYKLRDYMLNRFNIVEKIVDPSEIRFQSRLSFLRKPQEFSHYIEKHKLQFDDKVLSLKGNVYLDGSWQSWRYSVDIRDTILKDITVKAPPNQKNLDMLQEIRSKNSVSVHIRRQDYVNNPKTLQFHGVCSVGFYQKCISMMCERVPDPTFFIFSDDPAWAEKNIKTGHTTVYVNHNGDENCQEDLRLMSACSNFITANSSFSWWGAWLSTNPNKVVIVPKPWVQSKELKITDLIPPSWIEVPINEGN